MLISLKFFVVSTLTGLVFVNTLPAQDETKKKEQENSDQLIDREQLQQAGMEVGQSWTQTAGENMMALGKEEFQYGLHKIEDRIDKEGERIIDIETDDSRDEVSENTIGTDLNNYNETFETFSFPRPLKLTHSPKYLNSDLLRSILSKGLTNRRVRRSDSESAVKATETQSPSGKPPDFSSLTGSNPFNISSPLTPSSSGSSSQTAMMIIGGFTALMMPVQGAAANPNNIGSMLQMAQQYGPGSGGGSSASNPLTSQG